IDLGQTEAQTVMSSPLLLLNPKDSLWTAHQEMQQRRVGRLVVSWNWGRGLGIVTQTSLLRVFDPDQSEMLETVQYLVQSRYPQAVRSPLHRVV
ncbi:MAG: CBS domain-containing protein, partial [Cyanobacteria bacterium J06559_3]